MTLKKLTLLALATLALAACGGGNGGPSIDAAPHIKGTVAGTMFNATAGVSGSWTAAGALANLNAELPGTPPVEGHNPHWGVYNLTAAPGTYSCGALGAEDGLEVDLHDTVNDIWYESYGAETGSCSVRVEAVSETEISGTFTATLVRDADASTTVTVSNGTFRVPRSEALPD